MALKRDTAEYWSATQAIAYIGFDIPNPSRDWRITTPNEDQRAVIGAAVSEILDQVEAGNLTPDWNGERDEYGDAPELTHAALDRLISNAMGILNLGGNPYRNLQFRKSEIQGLWTAGAAPANDRRSEPADNDVAENPAPGRRDKKQTMAALETWAQAELAAQGHGINRDSAIAWGQRQSPKVSAAHMRSYYASLDDSLKRVRGDHGARRE